MFWSRYIEPFLEDLCVSEITVAMSMAREKRVDAKLLLPELQGLLSAGFRKVYARMADVDRLLMDKGFPDSVEPKPIGQVRAMDKFLDERIRAEIAMWKPKSRIEDWYEKNKFWVWAIGILLSILLGIVGLLANLG